MTHKARILALACLALLVFIPASEALAWGPATHVKLASDLLGQLAILPPAIAAILSRNARDYFFGNIAADVVLAKKLSRVRQFCHHWTTGFSLLDDAPNDSGRAFALGYLSHLAADTVAHGKFLPRQMTLTRSTVSFGHLYWELRADSTIGPFYWDRLRDVLHQAFEGHQACLHARLTDTFLPFSVNWRLFYRMNNFVSQRLLRQAMDRWYMLSRWQLSDQMMREYRAECLERMMDVVVNQRSASVLNEDPNGNAALAYTKMQRRQLRRMSRAGLIAPHILYEIAATHGPSVPARPRSNGDAPPPTA